MAGSDSHWERMWRERPHSDVTIKCKGREWFLHKIVLVAAPFFANALGGQFKRSGQEAKTSVIDLPDDDPDAVEAMLSYLYNGRFEDVPLVNRRSDGRSSPSDNFTFYVTLYLLADKYSLNMLKSDITRSITTQFEQGRYLHANLNVIAFLQAIKQLYDGSATNDRQLKDAILTKSDLLTKLLLRKPSNDDFRSDTRCRTSLAVCREHMVENVDFVFDMLEWQTNHRNPSR
ncbi:MAG: hypothetical protein M1828_004024 [Chrysothrix sp. TS-e1954]|nr:MAG: hypothetical protein M1828_004024 [Chrysothrix sp. TS-e1954]